MAVNLVHQFLDEFVPLAVLPPLIEKTISNVPTEEAEEDTRNEEANTIERDKSEVEVIKVTASTGMSLERKRTRDFLNM